MRVYNFSSGPAKLPEEVLQQASEEMLSWHGKGYSIMETSHRSPEFTSIIEETEQLLRTLLGIPDSYSVLLLQGVDWRAADAAIDRLPGFQQRRMGGHIDHAALLQHHDAIGHGQRLFLIVGHHDGGHTQTLLKRSNFFAQTNFMIGHFACCACKISFFSDYKSVYTVKCNTSVITNDSSSGIIIW